MGNDHSADSATPSIADLSARAFNQRIADPEVFCGGGSVAALVGAGAGATALLVMQLSLRRKRNAARASQIQHDIQITQQIIERCYAAADADIASLDELLAAQREARSTGDQRRYLAALEAAALSPISMSEAISELIGVISSQLPIATRFTASDLGAAAALAEGAVRAALLTADVNIQLLREAPGGDQAVADTLQSRRDNTLQGVIDAASAVERETHEIISTRRKAEEGT